MLIISEAQRRAELFLSGQMLEALGAVEYELPMLLPAAIFSKTSCSRFIGAGTSSGDPLLHDRGSPQRHPAFAPPGRIPSVNQFCFILPAPVTMLLVCDLTARSY
jgi:hypothetical protein